MAQTEAPDDDHFTRFVKRKHCMTDGDGEILGVLYTAFELRPGETYLSCNSIKLVSNKLVDGLKGIKSALEGKMKIGKGVLTIGMVQNIKKAFFPKKVRVTLNPTHQDPSYSAVRQIPLEDIAALEKLASEHWAAWYRTSDI